MFTDLDCFFGKVHELNGGNPSHMTADLAQFEPVVAIQGQTVLFNPDVIAC
jgi:hypothetical protein